MKVVVGILFLFALFIVLMNVFGSVECTGLANQTALGLSRGVDRVSSPDFPYWNGDSQPTDPIYYDTADVKLCQEHTDGLEGYWRAFWGGSVPQYQVYYERFPEGFFSGGAAMWEESYPWSGGAGGQLVFWGAFRSGKALLVGGSKIIGRGAAEAGYKTNQFLRSAGAAIKNSERVEFVEKNARGGGEALSKDLNLDPSIIAKKQERGIDMLVTTAYKRIGKTEVGSLSKIGFFDDSVYIADLGSAELAGEIPEGSRIKVFSVLTNDGKIPISKKKIPLQIIDNDGTVRYIHFKEEGGKIIEIAETMDPIPPAGFGTLQYTPTELFETYLNDFAEPNEAARLRKMFSTDWKDKDLIHYKDVTSARVVREFEISQTQFFKEGYKPLIQKWEKFKISLSSLGYAVERHNMDYVERNGLVDALGDRMTAENWAKLEAIHPYTRLKATVAKKLGFKSESYVDNTVFQKYLRQLSENTAQSAFIPRDSKLLQYKIIKEMFEEDPARVVDENFVFEVQQRISKQTLGQKVKIVYKTSAPTEEEINRITKLAQNTMKSDNYEWSKAYYGDYLDNYVFKEQEILDDAGNVVGTAPVERMRFIGFAEQNTNALPVTIPMQFGKLEVNKVVTLDVTAFANVRGWWWKGEITQATVEETCTDNSICLYAHGQRFEKPIYLNNDSKKFFVRSWRPLGLERFAGIQAALMSIPPNPRFHLVGPCMGTAKIWKVQDYEGEPTVFVAMDKTDLGDKASNYCYVDVDYAREYLKIWGTSDIITVVEAVLTGGESTATKALVKSGFSEADPATLIQAFWEGTISWPKDMSKTFSSLTPEKMREALIPSETTTTKKEAVK